MNSNNRRPLAIITGGTLGLGLTLGQFLAARGFDLLITGRDLQRMEEAAQLIGALGGGLKAVAGDIADESHRQRVVEAVSVFGQLDLLVNNASTLGPLPMPELSEFDLEAMRHVFEVNTIAPLALLQGLRPYLAAAAGLVINLSSDAALGGYAGWGGYGASKAALDLVSKTLANELQDESITVVSVDPGDMRTTMHQDAFPGEDISDRPLPEVTLPFWAWLLGQERSAINGQRFEAQSELWQVPA
ncbi:MAG: SDR family oxidoreductase [Candidatus Promineifilaceae bacterium]|nr:SDR family oxidoreductase [Candidatus Promineifilaceae bacterium]